MLDHIWVGGRAILAFGMAWARVGDTEVLIDNPGLVDRQLQIIRGNGRKGRMRVTFSMIRLWPCREYHCY